MNMPFKPVCRNILCTNEVTGPADYCMECLSYLETYKEELVSGAPFLLEDAIKSPPPKFVLHEVDPHGRNPKEPGAKLDHGKSPVRRGLLEYFPRACLAVADVSAFGASKYAWKGWETVPEGIDRYGDAEVRHICKAAIEGPQDQDSQLLHAAHEAWNAMARLELLLREV